MRRVVTAMLLVLVLGACGSSDDEAGGPAADGAGSGEVDIVDFTFEPGRIEVRAGGTVTWVNEDAATHTVTATDGSFDSGGLAPGEQFEHSFPAEGTFDYGCTIHPSMTGSVTVTP